MKLLFAALVLLGCLSVALADPSRLPSTDADELINSAKVLPTMKEIREEAADIHEYLAFLGELRERMADPKKAQDHQASASAEVSAEDMPASMAEIDSEEKNAHAYLDFLSKLKDRVESESNFRASQAGGRVAAPPTAEDEEEDDMPTSEDIVREKKLVHRYLEVLAQLKTKVESGETEAAGKKLPTLAQIIRETAETRQYLAELNSLQQQLGASPTPMPMPAMTMPARRRTRERVNPMMQMAEVEDLD